MTVRHKRFGELVRARRKALRDEGISMTQTELGKRVGASQPAVAGWEKGLSIPPGPTLIRLCKILSIDIREVEDEPIEAA